MHNFNILLAPRSIDSHKERLNTFTVTAGSKRVYKKEDFRAWKKYVDELPSDCVRRLR